jgi:hypothetical protein
MVIIHKLNIRWFSFPHLPSRTEMLDLSGTCYRSPCITKQMVWNHPFQKYSDLTCLRKRARLPPRITEQQRYLSFYPVQANEWDNAGDSDWYSISCWFSDLWKEWKTWNWSGLRPRNHFFSLLSLSHPLFTIFIVRSDFYWFGSLYLFVICMLLRYPRTYHLSRTQELKNSKPENFSLSDGIETWNVSFKAINTLHYDLPLILSWPNIFLETLSIVILRMNNSLRESRSLSIREDNSLFMNRFSKTQKLESNWTISDR